LQPDGGGLLAGLVQALDGEPKALQLAGGVIADLEAMVLVANEEDQCHTLLARS
jgi:hypothetical protein